MSSMKLRDLIRAVRSCKTAAEERAVISKECALIRTAIKEEDERWRHRNVAKLMYIHMLGYPTHFGQMECLKLISGQPFPEKRIGYLGLTLLLTEQTEVLTLVTNSLKVDLSNSNQYIVALALVAIGNLATQDMARDLASDVDKLLRSTNSYLRKKAALAAIRLLKKEPDLIEHMSERIIALLKDRAHGVLLTGLQLMIEVLNLIPEIKTEYLKLVPSLVRLLRNFISMGFSPEHDVSGITDPFMQVKLLNILRRLGKGDEKASDDMNDVLAQVATNTETSKNAGNAILYECVQTIMEVESDSGLRVLAVNILGRFLLNRDNNIRYVALNSLSKVVSEDIASVQRHRNTIVECLKDADISIRQRAFELIYQLVNEQNVVTLMAELLNYLVVANTEQKANLVPKIMTLVEKFSPNKKWRVDTIITMLSIAGAAVDESVPRLAIVFIAQSEGLQGYIVHRLFRSIQEDTSSAGLMIVALWCIGEYGNLLTRPFSSVDPSDPSNYSAMSEPDIIAILDKCARLHNSDAAIKAVILNSLMKLSSRLSPSSRSAILEVIQPYQHSMYLELQQRSVEYSLLMNPKWDHLRSELLGSMPILDEAAMQKRKGAYDEAKGSVESGQSMMNTSVSSLPIPVSSSNSSGGVSLLDLDDIFGGGSAKPPAPALTPSNLMGGAPVAQSAPTDLLSDIFSMTLITPTPVSAPTSAPVPTSAISSMGLGIDIMSPKPTNPIIKAYDKAGFQVSMELSKPNNSDPSITRITCRFYNLTSTPMDSLIFQAAVPKYLKLEMMAPSSTTIPPGSSGAVTQEIRLTNSMQGEKSIMLKLKIGYNHGGHTVEEQTQVSNFPERY